MEIDGRPEIQLFSLRQAFLILFRVRLCNPSFFILRPKMIQTAGLDRSHPPMAYFRRNTAKLLGT